MSPIQRPSPRDSPGSSTSGHYSDSMGGSDIRKSSHSPTSSIEALEQRLGALTTNAFHQVTLPWTLNSFFSEKWTANIQRFSRTRQKYGPIHKRHIWGRLWTLINSQIIFNTVSHRLTPSMLDLAKWPFKLWHDRFWLPKFKHQLQPGPALASHDQWILLICRGTYSCVQLYTRNHFR